jgi:hypothetical protein
MRKIFLKYWIICILFNVATVFTIGAIFTVILENINQLRSAERIASIDIEYLMLVNLFVSFLIPLLYIFKIRKVRPIIVLLAIDLGFILIYIISSHVFCYHWPKKNVNMDWSHDILFTLFFTIPQAFIIPILINFYQTIMKRELFTPSTDKGASSGSDNTPNLSASYKADVDKDMAIKKKFNYFLFSIVLNLTIVFVVCYTFNKILRILPFNPYLIGGRELENLMLFINFFISFFIPFLYRNSIKKLRPFGILLLVEFVIIIIYNVIHTILFCSDLNSYGNYGWVPCLYYGMNYVLPLVWAYTVALHFNQSFMKKRFYLNK